MQSQVAVAPSQVPALSAWDRLRLGLLAVWLVLAVAAVSTGVRETPLADLEAAVAEGRVDSVLVLGEAVPPEQGFGTQVVQWQDGLVRRTAEATVGGPAVGGRPDVPSREEDLGLLLSRADPDLEVRRSAQSPFSSGGELLGWQVPSWVSLSALVVLLLQLGFLLAVPQTWRATRWAWLWLTTVPVVGGVLLLLLSGRTPGLPVPSPGSRRLTGGWAFLLAMAVTSLLAGRA